MFIPQTEDEIVAALEAGTLFETASFDGKRELPQSPAKNIDLAVDIAAMATDGGVVVYGIAEDEDKRLTIATPFALAGARERIDQIVRTSIAEPPFIQLTEIPTEAESTIGYVVVHVPRSPRAPHMVIAKGTNRYYGRGATGNKTLGEGEVARLYRRRDEWERTNDTVPRLDREFEDLEPEGPRSVLEIAVCPVARDPDSLDRILRALPEPGPGDTGEELWRIVQLLRRERAAILRDVPTSGQNLEFTDRSNWAQHPRGLSGTHHAGSWQLRDDGSSFFFHQRVGDVYDDMPVVFEATIVANVMIALRLAGLMLNMGGLFGLADVAVRIHPLAGRASYESVREFLAQGHVFAEETYVRQTRSEVDALLTDTATVALDLLERFLQALTQGQSGALASLKDAVAQRG